MVEVTKTRDREITLPKIGESIVSATVVRWFKKEGEQVALDEALLEVATDKVNSEIPSPVSGTLKQICASVDTEVDVGKPLAVMTLKEVRSAPTHEEAPQQVETPPAASFPEPREESAQFFSPAVLRLAREHSLSLEQLSRIRGSGEGGRVTKKDVERFLNEPLDNVVALTPMRKKIAENMQRSHREIPPAALFLEVDVTDLMAHIEREKAGFLHQHNAKLTITSFVIEALVESLQSHPFMQARFTEQGLFIPQSTGLGIAIHVDDGLVVPVLKEAECLPLAKKVVALEQMKHKARLKKLALDDLEGATITLTNFGISGIETGVAIVPHGQTAILGMGSVQKKVVALENDAIAVRKCCTLSLSFDHRVVDGIYACQFLTRIKALLQQYAQ